jgi:hypothetical protein
MQHKELFMASPRLSWWWVAVMEKSTGLRVRMMEDGEDFRVRRQVEILSCMRGWLEASKEAMTPSREALRTGMSG